ncbi:autotransporter-associated beta strand repeat-containing protein [Burkholderia gladioli]|uniref:autotransporter-associated beta strand repeat-containing protein n=1 Tax=Burkholderia gladioli TaxID=28095 RepID=UPI003D22DAC6
MVRVRVRNSKEYESPKLSPAMGVFFALVGAGIIPAYAAPGNVNLGTPGASFDISAAGGDQAIGALSGVAGTSVNLGANSLSFGDASNQTFAGTIGGAGGITKTGSGTETLTGTNTYAGTTAISAGTLALGAGGSLAASSPVNLLSSGATFDLGGASGAQTIGGLDGRAGTSVKLGDNDLRIGDAGNHSFSGTISGTGSLIKAGSGSETLFGAQTYTGSTIIEAGTLGLGLNGSLPVATKVDLSGASARLELGTGEPITIGGLSGVAGSSVDVVHDRLTFGDSGNETFGGTISGESGITKAGSGTETLTGANTYAGSTIVTAGTLAIGGGGSLSTQSSVQLTNSGAAFDVSGATTPQAIGGLAGVAGTTVALGGNTLTIGTTINDLNTASFGGTISGTGGIVKKGTVTETLTGTNTFTGGVTVDEGTLAIGAGGSLAGGNQVNLANAGAIFDISAAGTPQAIGALSGVAGSNVVLGGNHLSFGDASDASFGGTISGTGGITKTGTGTETLTGINSYTGDTTIAAGTLALGPGGSLVGGGTVNLVNAGATLDLSGMTIGTSIGGLAGVSGSTVNLGSNVLQIGNATDQTFAGTIAGGASGGIFKQGSGTETLTGVSTYSGFTQIAGGTLAIGAGGSIASSALVGLSAAGAKLDLSGAGGPQTIGSLSGISGTTVALGATDLTLNANLNRNFSGTITGTGDLTKSGAGTQMLSGVNTYTGATNISAGTLVIGEGGSISASSGVNLLAAGTAFDISAGSAPQTIGELSGVAGSRVSLGSNVLAFGNATDQTFAGAITGFASSGLLKQGSGTETLTGVSSYSGFTQIAGGTLAIGAGGSIASSQLVGLSAAGAKLDLSGAGGPQTIGSLSGISGTTVALGATDLTLNANLNQNFSGTITGTGGLAKGGTGAQMLSGVNTYTGATNINAGTLGIGDGGSIAASSGVNLVFTGTRFDISAGSTPQTIGALSGATGSLVSLGANTLTFGNATDQRLGSAIIGTGGIIKAGEGTEMLTASNSYTGGTTINAGTLAIGVGGSLVATGAVKLANAGASFDIGNAGSNQTIGDLSGVTGSRIALGANTLTFGGAANTTFAGTIGGTGGVVKTGSGVQTLSADSTYSGGTTLAAGTLVAGSNGALGTGTLSISAPATLDTSTAVTLGNAVNLGSIATIGGSHDLTLAGDVSGTGGLVKNGDATLTLSGNNSFSGGTTLNAGTLALGSATALGVGSLTVNGGKLQLGSGSLTFNSLSGVAGSVIDTGTGGLTVAGAGAYAGTLAGSGTLTKSGVGTLTLAGENTYTGGTTITGGTLQVGNGGTTGSITGHVANFGQLVFAHADNVVFDGQISGTGSLMQSGAGTLRLTGTNALSGATTVGSGTLDVAGTLAQSTVNVMSGATVTGTGTIGGLVLNRGATAALQRPGVPLNVAGKVEFQAGSILQVVATPQQSGSVAATGSASINGGTVQVLATGTGSAQTQTLAADRASRMAAANTAVYSPLTRYTIVSADGGVTGAFTDVSTNLAFLKPLLSYSTNSVVLSFVTNGATFADVAQTRNQRSAAAAIGSLGAGNPIYDTLLSSEAGNARAAFNALDGEFYASMKSVLLTDSRYVREAVTDRVRQGLAPSSGPLSALAAGGASQCGDASTVLSGPAGGAAAQQRCQTASYQPVVWGQAFGGRSRLDGDGNASSISRSMTGFVAGADLGFGNHWRAGVAGGVTHSSLDNDTQSSASVDSYSVSIYGGGQFGALGLRGGAAYTFHRVDGDRYLSVPGLSDHTQSGVNARTAQVFGEVGYALPAGALAFEPFVNLAYVNLHTDGMSETGGAAALSSVGESNGVGFSTAGLRVATKFDLMSSGSFTARAMAGWRHAFGTTTPTSTFAFAGGGASFQVAGVPIARDAAVVELGIDANLTRRLKLGLTYSGQYGSGVRDNAVLGNLLWKF